MINEVSIIDLTSHLDYRGFFREVSRTCNLEMGIGQISHSMVYPGVIKAWHGHNEQTQLNYVVNGVIRTVLYDNRKESSTYKEIMEFLVGDNQKPIAYVFPPNVLHGYKCLSGPMNIIYVTSGIYDIKDGIRLKYNEPYIDYDWLKIEII